MGNGDDEPSQDNIDLVCQSVIDRLQPRAGLGRRAARLEWSQAHRPSRLSCRGPGKFSGSNPGGDRPGNIRLRSGPAHQQGRPPGADSRRFPGAHHHRPRPGQAIFSIRPETAFSQTQKKRRNQPAHTCSGGGFQAVEENPGFQPVAGSEGRRSRADRQAGAGSMAWPIKWCSPFQTRTKSPRCGPSKK